MTAAKRYRRTIPQKYKHFGRKVVSYAGKAAMARYGTPGGVRRLANDVNYIKSRLNTEAKYLDTQATTAPATSSIVCVNQIAQGTDAFNRVGNKLRVASLQSNLKFNIHGSATATVVRCCLVLDKAPNGGGAPGITDVFVSSTPYSLRNVLSMRRFKVLRNFWVRLDTSDPETMRLMYKKLNFRTSYNTTTGAVTAIQEGALYWMFISDEATNGPTISYNTRLRFIDN